MGMRCLLRTYEAEISMIAGVTSPIKTVSDEICQAYNAEDKTRDLQLFNQLDAVAKDTPLLLIDNGNTSLGSTHPKERVKINAQQRTTEQIGSPTGP